MGAPTSLRKAVIMHLKAVLVNPIRFSKSSPTFFYLWIVVNRIVGRIAEEHACLTMDPDWVPSTSRNPVPGKRSRRRSAPIQAAQTGALHARNSDDDNAESKDSDDKELGNSEEAIDTLKTSAGLGPAPEPLSPQSDPSTPRDDVPERASFADDGGKSQMSEGFVHNQDENLSKAKGFVTSDMSALGAIPRSDHTNSPNTVSAQKLPRKRRSHPVALPLESTPPGYIIAGYIAAVTEPTAQEALKPHEYSDTLTATKYIQESISRGEAIVDRILQNGPPVQKEVRKAEGTSSI